MKRYDIVKIVGLNNQMQDLNLELGFHGVILSTQLDKCEVLFFNDNNVGDATICEVANSNIELEDASLPSELKQTIDKSINEIKDNRKSKILTQIPFGNCDYVELIVDRDRYNKHNIHKGDKGFVAIADVIKDEILVDFTYVDNGNLCGEVMSVNIHDLKKLDNPESKE